MDEPPTVHASDVFRQECDGPRPLTSSELRGLVRTGFPEVAARLAAGTCPDCGLNKLSATHADLCERSEPTTAPPSPRQPWEPRPPGSKGGDVVPIDITTPAGAPPRDLLDEALRELHGQISIMASGGEQPPQLGPAIIAARVAQEMDDVNDLVKALRDVAHAAVVCIVRVRASTDHEPSA